MSELRIQLADEEAFLSDHRPRRADFHYASPVAFVLREGRAYTPAAYEPGRWGGFQGEPRQCFRNALILALAAPELSYVEGYATTARGLGLAIQHAWCATADGTVVDPTWTVPGTEYLGVSFGTEWVDDETSARGVYGVIDDWQRGWPLLREPFAPA